MGIESASMGKQQMRHFLVLGTLVIPACTLNGTLYLHNSTGESVTVRLHDEQSIIEEEVIQANGIAAIELNVNVSNEIQIVTSEARWCYSVTAVPRDWIESGIFSAKVYASLRGDGSIVIYPTGSDEKTFFTEPVPKQPPPFPILPKLCYPE